MLKTALVFFTISIIVELFDLLFVKPNTKLNLIMSLIALACLLVSIVIITLLEAGVVI